MRRKSVAILIGLVICLAGAGALRFVPRAVHADSCLDGPTGVPTGVRPEDRLAAAEADAGTADGGAGDAEAGASTIPSQPPSQVDAAYDHALQSLTREVSAARVGEDLTVGELVDRTAGGREELDRTLREARRVGGTRWIGGKESEVCQVQLEIAGPEVAAAMLRLAQADPGRAGVPVERLRRELASLNRRTFSATGTSLRPRVLDKVWYLVSDADRRKALQTAQDNVVDRLLEKVRDVELATGTTIELALKRSPAIRRALSDWLINRPVVDLEYGRGLQVRLLLSAPADELWDVLRSALEAQEQSVVPHPTDEAGWERVRAEVLDRLAQAGPPEGRAAAAAPRRVELPRPPRWIDEQVSATASAPPAGPGSRSQVALRAANDAKQRARDRARLKLDELRLKGDLTLGQAAREDRRIGEALDRVVARTQPRKIVYTPNGGAQATVTVNLIDVWREIEALYLSDSETADGRGFGPER